MVTTVCQQCYMFITSMKSYFSTFGAFRSLCILPVFQNLYYGKDRLKKQSRPLVLDFVKQCLGGW
jgi:hypothetical protein